MVSSARAREEVDRVVRSFPVSERWATRTLGVTRSVIRYRGLPGHVDYEAKSTGAVIAECVKDNQQHYGYRRITGGLRDAGWVVNVKHVARIMRAEGLLRPPKARVRPAPRLETVPPVWDPEPYPLRQRT
jgi:hypothetical protein